MRDHLSIWVTMNFTNEQMAYLRSHLNERLPRARGGVALGQGTIARTEQWASQPERHCVTLAHEHYPAVLRLLHDAPLVLYGQGCWSVFEKPALAIVGARQCSAQARALAFELGREVALRGWCVVSGLARGVDAAAHRGALASGVRASTIAVLGSGLEVIYPPEHQGLADEIHRMQGLLLTEFALNELPLACHFPQRNRLVACLSRGTVVVQAKQRSGSMITATLAADMGREVFAVPGQAGDPRMAGTHALLRQGATLVENVGDIWQAFGLGSDQ